MMNRIIERLGGERYKTSRSSLVRLVTGGRAVGSRQCAALVWAIRCVLRRANFQLLALEEPPNVDTASATSGDCRKP
jgi:hypothetical protein